MAFGPNFNWLVAIMSLLCALALQVAVNLANDFFDKKSGVDTEERLGPNRALQKGLVSSSQVMKAILFFIALALCTGGYLIFIGGWPILLLGVLSVIGVFWYSGGPFPLASLGLGEVTVFIFFGLVAVLGVEFLQHQSLTVFGWIHAVQLGLFSAAIMLVNNIRDIQTDTVAGKKTLAVRLGDLHSRKLYTAFIVLPLILQAILFIGLGNNVASVLPFLSLPLAVKAVKAIKTSSGSDLNFLLAGTAKLLMVFSILLVLGYVFAFI